MIGAALMAMVAREARPQAFEDPAYQARFCSSTVKAAKERIGQRRVAAINNFLIQEHYGRSPAYITGLAAPDPAASTVPLPPGPGLGVTVNLDGVREAAAEVKAGGISRAYFLDDGSVADR